MSDQTIKITDSNWNQALADELLNYLTGKLRCRHTAEELTHDTYIRLQQATEQAQVENVRGMAFRIATNLLIDHQRRSKVRERYICDDDLDMVSETVADPTMCPERSLDNQRFLLAVRKAMNQLPPDARTALMLHGLEGLTYSEIAARLGVSKAQVSKLLTMAMRHCTSQLDESSP